MQVDEFPAEADLRLYSAILDHVGTSVTRYERALHTYRRDFANRPFPQRPVNHRIIAAGLSAIDSARIAAAEARGFIGGSIFFDEQLESRRPPLTGDLLLLDSSLVQMRRFYAAAGTADQQEMRAANEEIRRMDQTTHGGWSAAYAHLGALSEAGLASGTGSIARLYEQTERLRWYAIQRLLAWGAVAYVLAFKLAAGATWLRRRQAAVQR